MLFIIKKLETEHCGISKVRHVHIWYFSIKIKFTCLVETSKLFSLRLGNIKKIN